MRRQTFSALYCPVVNAALGTERYGGQTGFVREIFAPLQPSDPLLFFQGAAGVDVLSISQSLDASLRPRVHAPPAIHQQWAYCLLITW